MNDDERAEGGLVIVIILVVIMIIIISSSFYLYKERTADRIPVLNLMIKVTDGSLDTENDRWSESYQTHLPFVENITTDLTVTQDMISPLEPPGDTPLTLPGVVVHVHNVDTGVSLTYWTSVSYDGSGYYNLTAYFIEPPVEGQSMKIIISINDHHGDDMFPYFTHDLENSSLVYTWQ
jgi:hypothetical protein